MPSDSLLKPSSASLGIGIPVDAARIDLDRVLALLAVVEAEIAEQAVHDLAKLSFVEERRGTAAEMQLLHPAARIEQPPLQAHFFHEVLHVGIGAVLVAGDDLVAAAVITERVAERHVHIDGQRLRLRVDQRCWPGQGACSLLPRSRRGTARRSDTRCSAARGRRNA
jgi:hypothetical protein